MRNSKDYTFDVLHQLRDAGNATATAAAQVGGADKILDLGTGRVDGRIIVDITAVEVATGNEGYKIWAEVSTSATFASGVWIVGGLSLGDSSVSLETVDSVVGRRELHFCNEINGTIYRYLRLYTVVIGTIDTTGINYVGYLVTN